MAAGKTSKKKALGRGLDSLLPDFAKKNDKTDTFFNCDIELIIPNRYQPRISFSKKLIEELADSIKIQGIIQPLTVRKHDNGYELVAGERRLRAAKKAGLSNVPVIVKEFSDSEILEISIIENIQREDLNSIEEAEAYQRLINEFQLTQEQVAKRVGKSRPAVANLLRLRHLPVQVKEEIKRGLLSMGHARAILGLESTKEQNQVSQLIIAKKFSVRETENLIKKLKAEKEKSDNPGNSLKSSDDIHFADISESLSGKFGTKVRIIKSGKKGSIRIEFYDDKDLDRIINLFQNITV